MNWNRDCFYSWLGDDFHLPFSIPKFMFLDPRATEFYVDWDRMTRNTVALLRAQTAADPGDTALFALIGELASRSPEFGQLWAHHDVRRYREGPKRFQHPAAGRMEFVSESLDVADANGLVLIAYTVAAGSSTAEALAWLASWNASTMSASAVLSTVEQPTE